MHLACFPQHVKHKCFLNRCDDFVDWHKLRWNPYQSILLRRALAQCESFPSPPRPQLQRLDLLPRHCAARCHPPSSPRHARGCHRA